MDKPALGLSDQVTLNLACAASVTSYSLEFTDLTTAAIVQCRQWKTILLISVYGCAG